MSQLSQQELDAYIDGEIIIAGDSGISKGTVHGFRLDDNWAIVDVTVTETAIVAFANRDRAKWKAVKNPNRSPVILRRASHVTDAGQVVFDESSPRGTTALISRP